MTMRGFWIAPAVVAFGMGVGAAQMPPEGIAINRENRTIAVTATENVLVTADVATLHLGFTVYAADSASAYAEGARISNAVVTAIKTAGVADVAIESVAQSTNPVQPYEMQNFSEADKAQRKFATHQEWTIRIPASDPARILDAAVKAGANQSGQIDWSLKDANAPQSEAATKALQRARQIAGELAGGLSAKLGMLIFASNQAQSVAVRPAQVAMGVYGGSGQSSPLPLAIHPPQITKTATVYAVFAIE